MSRVINKEIEQVAIDLLKHHPRNANNGDVEAIKKSLAVNGWYGSVVVNTGTKHILAGNHRVMAAKALGWETVPVQWVDVTPEEELRILVVDNRTTRIGQDDTTKITDILAELANTPIGLEGTGYGAADLDALIDELAGTADPAELLTDPDEVPEEVETRCKPGDLWILGRHRLLCGDSTKADDVARLMGNEKACAVVTDSPYGINHEGIQNDDPEGLRKLFDDMLNVLPIENAIVINFQSPRLFPVWLDALRNSGHKFERMLWWREVGNAKPWRGFRMQGEAILLSSVGKPVWVESRSDPDTFDDSNIHRDGHPTQKPVTLISALIGHTSGNIFDPFLGSGTTLIAAEKTNRKCYGMEISPKYCDVVIQRWENATGQKAVLDGR